MAVKTPALSSIIVTQSNEGALNETLAAIKGRAKVFPSAADIIGRVDGLEDQLRYSGVAASNRVGCTYEYRGPGPDASSYGYKKTVASFTMKRTAKGWVVTWAGNVDVHPKQKKVDQINLTPKAKHNIIHTALDGFGLLPEKQAEAA